MDKMDEARARVRLSCDEIAFSGPREIILLTKGCKKTNFIIQAEYSSPLIPLKSFH